MGRLLPLFASREAMYAEAAPGRAGTDKRAFARPVEVCRELPIAFLNRSAADLSLALVKHAVRSDIQALLPNARSTRKIELASC